MYPVIRAKGRKPVLIQREYMLEESGVPETDASESGAVENGAAGNSMSKKERLEYLQFPGLSKLPRVSHLFSTRLGGVSREHLGSLNFSYSRGDLPENVRENYHRAGRVMGCDEGQMVASDQTHTTNIRIVTAADAGKGVVREKDYREIDGLITGEPGICLACFYADCVPLYFVDPVKQVIGLAHSGWRGTQAGMGICMAERMQEEFGCRPEDLVAAIGPSICQDCYEISEEVAKEFTEGFWAPEHISQTCERIRDLKLYPHTELLKPGKEAGKYQLDLWLANLIILLHAGIRPEHIDVTDICTCHNPEYLFSHRASRGMRGNLAAFLMLKES